MIDTKDKWDSLSWSSFRQTEFQAKIKDSVFYTIRKSII